MRIKTAANKVTPKRTTKDAHAVEEDLSAQYNWMETRRNMEVVPHMHNAMTRELGGHEAGANESEGSRNESEMTALGRPVAGFFHASIEKSGFPGKVPRPWTEVG
ncbi:hypothetical protein KSS87_021560 [Heliosperma pusillum]|nr:hypothetical protein KSS87_021560 [Heliosperma pusillum]